MKRWKVTSPKRMPEVHLWPLHTYKHPPTHTCSPSLPSTFCHFPVSFNFLIPLHPCTMAIINLLSLWHLLPQIYTMSGLLYLASFSYHHVFGVPPCWTMHQHLLLFHRVIIHLTNIHNLFGHSQTDEYLSFFYFITVGLLRAFMYEFSHT